MGVFWEMRSKKSVLFIANKCPHYRIPLFNALAEKFDIDFVFTHEEKKITGLKASQKILRGIGRGKFKVHFGILKEIKTREYDSVVMLPPDPLHLIDNLIIYRFLRKHNIPFSFYVGRWEYKNTPFKQRISEPFYRIMLRNAKSCICYGSKAKEWLVSQGVSKDKIFISYNINPEVYDNLRKSVTQKDGKGETILYVGRLIKRKGVDYLLRAFSEIRKTNGNVRLILIGGGDFYKLGEKSEEFELKTLASKLNIEKDVVFLGHQGKAAIDSWYKKSDLFVCPSITLDNGEAWGHVIEESLSFGLPVITTDAVGAGYDLIEGGVNGFIVPEKDSGRLHEKIKSILDDPLLLEKMSKESRATLKKKKFSFEEIVNQFKF